MDQILQAVDISFDPTASQDLKRQALQFLTQVKNSEDGWQVCLGLFVKTPTPSDISRVYALDVVNGAILRFYRSGGDTAPLNLIKDTLLKYVQQSYGPGASTLDNAAMQNKLTQTITYLFMTMYGESWTTFFGDILQLTSSSTDTATGKPKRDNLTGVAFYLRIVASIHDEVADILFTRESGDSARNTLLKDQIRERDMATLVTSWHEILVEWKGKNDDIVEMTLKVIGRWVSWISISLVLTPDFVNGLWELLGVSEKVKDATLEAMSQIVTKKMSSSDKIELIKFMKVVDIISGLLAQDPALKPKTQAFNVDLAERVAQLVNIVGSELVKGIDFKSLNEEMVYGVFSLIQQLMPSFFFLFSNEYDEVSSELFPFTAEFLAFIKQYRKEVNSLPAELSILLPQLLNAIITKMQFDESCSWGDENELSEEAEFMDMRKKLKNLQDMVGAIDVQLLIETLYTIVNNALDKASQGGQGAIGWRELDLAMYELHVFGDLAFQNGNLFVKSEAGMVPNGNAAVCLVEMVIKLMNSNITSYPHPSIQLQFMENMVRYVNVFEVHKDLIPRALESFVQGCHSTHVRVRARAWYLFQRFVKIVRTHIGQVAETVIRAVGDLLEVKAELPEGEEDMSSDDGKKSDTTFDNQLNLFEAVGSLASTSSIPPEKQVDFARDIINPLFLDIQNTLPIAQNGDARSILQVHHDIMALGTLARGFSDWAPGTKSGPPPSPLVSAEFERVAEAVLVSLECLSNQLPIREAARFSFSRMIGVLGPKILPLLPRWIDGLLGKSSTKEEIQMFLRLLEQVIHGFKTEIFEILNSLFTPLLEILFTALAQPTEGTDDEISLGELRREFLNFFQVIFNNDLGLVFVSDKNLPAFEKIVDAIENFASDNKDSQTQKGAFGLMSRICASQQIVYPGIADVIQRFSAACWAVPTGPGFNPKDAQTKIVLGEIGAVQKAIYDRAGTEFANFLQTVYFPSVGVPPSLVENYLTALQTMNEKDFKRYFRDFASGKVSR